MMNLRNQNMMQNNKILYLVNAQIKKQTKVRNLADILITHDMGVIAETANRVAVMKSGNLVEIGETQPSGQTYFF